MNIVNYTKSFSKSTFKSSGSNLRNSTLTTFQKNPHGYIVILYKIDEGCYTLFVKSILYRSLNPRIRNNREGVSRHLALKSGYPLNVQFQSYSREEHELMINLSEEYVREYNGLPRNERSINIKYNRDHAVDWILDKWYYDDRFPKIDNKYK